MTAETRKQREIREREGRILEVARAHLLNYGYLGLNMERIAAEMEYSKGTIYQHFRNKEEILIALANEALEQRVGMFKQAALLHSQSRLRIAAIGAAAEAFVETAPYYFAVEQVILASSIWEKTSEERRCVMQNCQRQCMGVVVGVVRDAVAQRDLVLPEDHTPEDVVFALWSINLGAQTITTSSSESLNDIGVPSPITSLRKGQNQMLDGFGWQLLSTEFDYFAHMDQVKQELCDHVPA